MAGKKTTKAKTVREESAKKQGGLSLFWQKVRKPLHVVTTVLEWAIFAVLLATFFVVLSPMLPTKKYIYTYIVATGSMEPAIKTGSIALVRPVEVKTVKKGDIITFTSPNDPKQTILHRVYEVKEKNNSRFFRTKGDNNNAPDSWTVSSMAVKGSYISAIPYLGHPAALLKTQKGFVLLIIIPAIILAILQVKTIKEGIEEEVERRTKKALAKTNNGKMLKSIIILAFILNGLALWGTREYVHAIFTSTVTLNGVTFAVIDFRPPSIPTNLRFTTPALSCGGITNTASVTANWDTSTPTGSKTIDHYEYEWYGPSGESVSSGTTTTLTYISTFLAGNGIYGFRVRAVDNLGYKSDWTSVGFGDSCQVTYDPNAPPVPLLRSPANNSVVNSSGLKQTWTFVTDPEGSNPVTYYYESCNVNPLLQAGQTCPSGQIRYTATYTIANKQVISGEERIVKDANGAIEGTFWWRVRTTDTVGNRSAWSEVWKMTIDNTAPTVPGPIGWTIENPPVGTDYAAGSDFDRYATCGGAVNYSPMSNIWGPSTDANGVTYEREVYSPENTLIFSNSPTTNYANGIAPSQTTYWVRIRAKDAAGNYSAWTPKCSITYQVVAAPTNLGWWQGSDARRFTAPDTTKPLDYTCGTSSAPAVTNKNWIAHSWSAVTSPSGVKYQREVTYPDGTTIAYYLPDTETNNYTNYRGFNETPPYLDLGQEGVWKTRVRAFVGTTPAGTAPSSAFVSEWSNECYIRLDHTAPTSVITTGFTIGNTNLNNPDGDNEADGYHNHFFNIMNWNGRLDGTASDTGSGVKEVWLSIHRTRPWPFNVDKYWNGSSWVSGTEETIRVKATGTTTWSYQITDHPTGTYTIKSHAVDNAGNIENTYTLVIVNENDAPAATINLSDDKKSVSFEVLHTERYNKLSYELSYNAYDTAKGILGADIDIANSESYAKSGLDLATCSSGVCTYDAGVKDFHLKVTLTKETGEETVIEQSL